MQTQRTPAEMGPLADGQTVAIIGGGPGGMACALALKREADRRRRRVRVVVFEGKRFGLHYNQCSGVLSPPLQQILQKEYDITLPAALCQRAIRGYVLHAEEGSVVLNGREHGGVSLAVRRVEFDEFLERCARERGIEVVEARATDLEFRRDEVVVFTWGGTFRAAAVVGAFGLSRAMTATLARCTPYRPPRALDTVVTNFHPAGEGYIPSLLDDHIHVLLPPLPRIEFGALIPKGNHVTVIVAGEGARTDDMDAFLALPAVRRIASCRPDPEDYFRGRFPVSLAPGGFGDRYVTIGDAAGLVRPFKGKGINSAIITGGLAAVTMVERGVSAEAFRSFHRRCAEITGDMPYGRLVRRLAHLTSHHFSLDPVVRLAEKSPALREVLFDCVSGRESYRRIVCRRGNLPLAARLGAALVLDRVRRLFG
ncbi:MAG: NAD(P)/FAD-dependent oxidoreductase [Armatimonadetes bacterium]|nr:NAD(P)/FAD-dependent oxidoreductase [Armatimonadota bacterium]